MSIITLYAFIFNVLSFSVYSQDYDSYLIAGYKALENKDYLIARQYLDKAILNNSNGTLAYLYRGIANMRSKKLEQAESDFKTVINFDKSNDEAYNNLGVIKCHLKEDCSHSIVYFNQAIQLNPENSQYFCNRGFAKQKLEDYRGAIIDYNLAIKYKQDYGYAFFNRGLTKILSKDLDGGCLDLSKAGELGEIDAYQLIKQLCN